MSCHVVFGYNTFHFSLIAVDPCDAQPCLNNGSCLPSVVEDESSDLIGQSVASYMCVCKDGFTGKNCETGEAILHDSLHVQSLSDTS